MITAKIRPTIGECEVCNPPVPNTEVWRSKGNIMMCAAHLAEENSAYEKAASANKAIQEFRRADASITVKGDIHLVKGIPIVELKTAIHNDSNIRQEDKQEAIVSEIHKHRVKLDEIIFSRREELSQLEMERKAWIVNGQEEAAKLSAAALAKYREYDVNYVSSAPSKKVKTTKPAPSTSSTEKQLRAAFEKYGITDTKHKSMIRMQINVRKTDPDETARQFAEMFLAGKK